MSNKSVHIKPPYLVDSIYDRKAKQSVAYRIGLLAVAVLIWVAVIVGGILAN